MTTTFNWKTRAAALLLAVATGGVTALAQEYADTETDGATENANDTVGPDDSEDLPPARPEPETRTDTADREDDEQFEAQRSDRRSQDRSVVTDRDDTDQARADADDGDWESDRRFDRRTRNDDARQRRDWGIDFTEVNDGKLEIRSVRRNGVLFRSGLREGDVLVSLDGQPVQDSAAFARLLTENAGRRIPVVVLRDGDEQTIYIAYHRQDGDDRRMVDEQTSSGSPYLGVTFEPGTRGVVMVGSVAPGSPAEEAGLRTGDILLSLNDREVSSPYDVIETVASMEPGDSLHIEFSRRVADNTRAVIAERPVRQARFEPGVRRESYNFDSDGRIPRTTRDFDAGDEGFRDFDDRRILRDRDEDGRILDRDRRVLPRRRD
jgi:C-terminal processing protease CtpA/Prc